MSEYSLQIRHGYFLPSPLNFT